MLCGRERVFLFRGRQQTHTRTHLDLQPATDLTKNENFINKTEKIHMAFNGFGWRNTNGTILLIIRLVRFWLINNAQWNRFLF